MSHKQDEPWQDVLLRKVREKRGGRLGPLQVKVRPGFLHLMDAAARQMGVNRSTFIRRAVAVQIASALGVDVRIGLADCPGWKPWGQNGWMGANEAEFDDGSGIEKWCTHPGCDGSHL